MFVLQSIVYLQYILESRLFESLSVELSVYQGAGKRPRQCSPNGPKSNKTATRGPEGPESGLNKRVRGPEGPEDEQSLVFVSALASATICFSRFSQKSRFSWHNLSTLMTAKMHENFSRLSYLQHEHRVKKSKQFRKNAAFVSKSRPSLSLSLDRGQNFAKCHPCLIGHNFSSLGDINLINTAIDR